MRYDLLELSMERKILEAGTNVYPNPAYHLDRIMPVHDLMYIYDGEWDVQQDDVNYHLHSGDLMLMHAGGHHFGTGLSTPNMRNMFLHINPLPGDRTSAEMSPAEAGSYMEGNTVCLPTVIHCGLQNSTTSLMAELVNAFWTPREDQARKMTLMLNYLLGELAHLARNTLAQPEEWFTLLLRELRMNPSRFYSQEEAAEIAHMSVRSFSAHFRRMMGRSFHEYQLDQKLDQAYQALRSGGYTVRETAMKYGFCDPYYFSRVFKKNFGISPGEVKRDPGVNLNRPEMR